MHVLTTARRPPLFRRCECGRGVPRLHGEIAIHRGPVPPHPGVGCLIWMGATSGPRWLSAFGGDACACILYGGLASGWFGWRTLACILYGGLGLDGRFGIRVVWQRTTEGACGGAGRRTGRYEAQARVGICVVICLRCMLRRLR